MHLFRRGIEILREEGVGSLIKSIEKYFFIKIFKSSPFIASFYSLLSPLQPFTIIVPTLRGWVVYEVFNKSKSYVPSYNKAYRGSRVWKNQKLDRYSKEGFVEPREGDTIVEVGAFRGEFTQAVADRAARILAFEPDPYNQWFLLNNTEWYENVEVVPIALWDQDSVAKFELGDDSTQSSFINIDSGETKRSVVVQRSRLDNLKEVLEINKIDYLKMDAEGAEPEAIKGTKDIDIQKIAIDCGYERFGENTVESVQEVLSNRGYEVKITNDNMVFARR